MKPWDEVFDIEIQALKKVQEGISECIYENFLEAISSCEGRVVWIGMGKSGNICQKIVSTMQSLGIKAFFVHPAEALHGGLGVLDSKDLIIAVSNSGETDEVLELIPYIKKLGTKLFSIVGKSGSTQEKFSDETIILPEITEAYLGTIVPTSSTTVMLVLGDALAISSAKRNGFTEKEFGLYHPKGMLGKKLTLTIEDIMISGENNSIVDMGDTIEKALFEMCEKALSGVCVVSNGKTFEGILTDGDFRRLYNKHISNMYELKVRDVMTKSPTMFRSKMLVSEAIEIIKASGEGYAFYPVVDEGILKGAIRMTEIVKSGLYT